MSAVWGRKVFNVSSANVYGLALRGTGGRVREDSVNSQPSVVLEASNSNLLDALRLNVVPGATMDTLDITFDPSRALQGAYLLNVYMPTHSLKSLRALQDGDAVIYPNTLANGVAQDLRIQASGSGSIFVQATDVVARRLELESQGAGRIQFLVDHTVMADQVTLFSGGTGPIAYLADVSTTNSFAATARAAGSVFVGPATATTKAAFTTMSLDAKVMGEGDVVYANLGKCNSSMVQATGKGNVFASAVHCQDSNVMLFGRGDVFVASSFGLQSKDAGVGDVYASIDESTRVLGKFKPMPATVAVPSYNVQPMPEPKPVPIQRAAVAVVTSVRPSTTLKPTPSPTAPIDSMRAVSLGFGICTMLFALAVLFKLRRSSRLHGLHKDVEFTVVATPKLAIKHSTI